MKTILTTPVSDWLSILLLLLSLISIHLFNGFQYRFIKFLYANIAYNLFTYLILLFFTANHSLYQIVYNCTLPFEAITFLLFLHHLWHNKIFKRYLQLSIAVVLIVWLASLFIYGIQKVHYINLLCVAIWFIVTGVYSLLLLFTDKNENEYLLFKYLISASFLMYSFTYVIIEITLLISKNNQMIQDAWSVNVWAFLISRLIMFITLLLLLKSNTLFSKSNYKVSSS